MNSGIAYLSRLLTGIIITGVILSCTNSQNENKQLNVARSNILAFFQSFTKDDPEGVIVDSVSVLKIDTLNEKIDSMNAVVAYLKKLEGIESDQKLSLKKMRDHLEMVRINKRIGNNYDYYVNQFNDQKELVEKLGFESKKINNHIDRLDSLIKEGKYDTLKTSGYMFLVKVFAHDSKMSNNNIDSAYVPLDTNFLINQSLMKKSKYSHEH